jgi:hypothetical protein
VAVLVCLLLGAGCQVGYMSQSEAESGPNATESAGEPGSPEPDQDDDGDGDDDDGDVDEGSEPPDPGTVTLHRLNNSEYNNTVRDLLGTGLRPADNFPEDDFGYGFNNIADVLSISPLLFDRQMQAADALVGEIMAGQQASSGEPIFRGEAEDLGGSAGTAQGAYWNLYSNGEVTTNVDLQYDGEYTIAVKAYASQGGPEPAKMEIRVDAQVLKTIDVTAVASAPATYQVSAQLEAGRRIVSVGFINDFYDADQGLDRNLYVDWFEVAPVASDAEQQDDIFVCEPAQGQERACARQILEPFASRAWRRPVAANEVDGLLDMVDENMAAGDDFRTAMSVALRAVLVSPHFTFRVEKDPEGDQPHALGQWELASRLSYFLWSSMPDAMLRDLAKNDALDSDRVLREQVQRMLDSPKARAMVDGFASQWLKLDDIDNASPDYELFPQFDDSLRASMKQETRRFVKGFFDEERPLTELLTAEYSFVDARLAQHYGIEGVEGADFQRVDLTGTERGGLLTQGAILTATSYPTRTSPVQRGKWVLGELLCQEPPPPPPEVENIDEDSVEEGQTLREIMEQHASNPQCANCHRMMDPIGFGMSNYDGVGAWRETQNGQTVDASGVLPGGQSFHGAKELSQIISKEPSFMRCVSRKVLTYALGRGVEGTEDGKILRGIVARTIENGATMRELIAQVVLSRAFRMRRAQRSDEISDSEDSDGQ